MELPADQLKRPRPGALALTEMQQSLLKEVVWPLTPAEVKKLFNGTRRDNVIAWCDPTHKQYPRDPTKEGLFKLLQVVCDSKWEYPHPSIKARAHLVKVIAGLAEAELRTFCERLNVEQHECLLSEMASLLPDETIDELRSIKPMSAKIRIGLLHSLDKTFTDAVKKGLEESWREWPHDLEERYFTGGDEDATKTRGYLNHINGFAQEGVDLYVGIGTQSAAALFEYVVKQPAPPVLPNSKVILLGVTSPELTGFVESCVARHESSQLAVIAYADPAEIVESVHRVLPQNPLKFLYHTKFEQDVRAARSLRSSPLASKQMPPNTPQAGRAILQIEELHAPPTESTFNERNTIYIGWDYLEYCFRSGESLTTLLDHHFITTICRENYESRHAAMLLAADEERIGTIAGTLIRQHFDSKTDQRIPLGRLPVLYPPLDIRLRKQALREGFRVNEAAIVSERVHLD